jgi:peptidoglycan/LPS O-acetylase OafA/YrhL
LIERAPARLIAAEATDARRGDVMRMSMRWSAVVIGGVALAAAGWQPAAAQQQGTIYYMIPTLLDEFQTESQKAIEGVPGPRNRVGRGRSSRRACVGYRRGNPARR